MQYRRIAVRAVIIRENMLLCARLKKSPGNEDDEGQDYWCVPGGGVDSEEFLVSALVRELVEETGIKPDVGNLLYIQQFKDGGGCEHLEFFFHVKNSEDYSSINLSETTHGSIEIAEINFINPASNKVLPTFLTEVDFLGDTAKGVVTIFNNIESGN